MLLESLTQLLQGSFIAEHAVAMSGIIQLYLNGGWEAPQDELGMAAASAYEQSLAEALQDVLTVMQQALVDNAWPCSLRLLLPSLLSSMLGGSPQGSEIASHQWHLEVARCGYYSSVAAASLPDSRAGGMLVWLGYMQTMLQFKAGWLESMLSPEIIGRLVELTRSSLEDQELFVAWLAFWEHLPDCLEMSDAQRNHIQQTLRRAFERFPDHREDAGTCHSSHDFDATQGNSALPAALLVRCLETLYSSRSLSIST